MCSDLMHMHTLHAVLDHYDGALPKQLFLQLDNTTGSNKGQYLFSYLGMLISAGVFERVLVSFLPVGHTHEDIDQFFSRIAERLTNHDARCVEEMLEQIEQVNARRVCDNYILYSAIIIIYI